MQSQRDQFNTLQQPGGLDQSPDALRDAGDSFEEDEDEYNADSPEHEKKLLYSVKASGAGNEYTAMQD